MRGYSSHDAFRFHPESSLHKETLLHTAERYVLEAAVFWAIGACFMAGWSYATVGGIAVAQCVADGVVLAFVGLILAAIGGQMKLKMEGITPGIALALGIICIEASFPIGAVTGAIYNAIAGSFPDKSDLGNKLIATSIDIRYSNDYS